MPSAPQSKSQRNASNAARKAAANFAKVTSKRNAPKPRRLPSIGLGYTLDQMAKAVDRRGRRSGF